MRGVVVIFLVLVAFAAAKEGCEEPQAPGNCKGYFPRFWFDSNAQACVEFVYGGCQGNANNYPTVGECKNACLIV
ncbi:hypothetical protein V1264_013898 [Littorina saxatilis]|uniref:BPTI/Kunitz inhibitor domain-containing protein n=1 Tax=Littorina saxatilis TaxID=31220 RepID=A0AAN9BUF6_9CAEN